MKKISVFWSLAVIAAFLGGIAVSAQLNSSKTPIDPLDAVAAAPKNHKVLYEDDHIRFIEVTVQPGETENMHVHKYPSVLAFDAVQPKFSARFADGREMEAGRNFETPAGSAPLPPQIAKMRAELRAQLEDNLPKGLPGAGVGGVDTPHQLTNLDTFPQHFYRVEFKRMDGNGIVKQ